MGIRAAACSLLFAARTSTACAFRIQAAARPHPLGFAAAAASRRGYKSTTTAMSAAGGNELEMDAFAMRQFTDESYTGTKVAYDPQEFEDKVNEIFRAAGGKLEEGYAPFCKHVFVSNFAGVKTSTVKITPENEKLLVTGYEARTEKELPILSRWFESGTVETPEAKFLDIILYSREQIRKETAAMGKEKEDSEAPWGIISVKSQDVDHEIPMQPITMMRNALGKEEGGSGVPLEREKYMQSVEFWRDHAPVK
ncbi:unnamed protein product [Ectocarpus fasciculatus]